MKGALAALLLAVATASVAQERPAAVAVAPKPGEGSPDTILRAMKDELERSRTLSLASLDKPYFIQYTVEDVQVFNVSATLGGLFSTNQTRFRVPRVRVRVGDYAFDNSNYIYSDVYAGTRYDSDQLPLDDSYPVLRRSFWLATDRAFKTAVEAITRKRAALKNITQNVTLPDLWKAPPQVKLTPGSREVRDAEQWTARVKRLSGVFQGYPEVLLSLVSFDTSNSVYYLHNSEGTTLRKPESMIWLNVRASGQAADGMNVRDGAIIARAETAAMPGESDLEKATHEVAANVKALTAAPMGETYSGPVLVEGLAAAQLVADVLVPNLNLPRRPAGEPGRPAPFMPSALEGRINSRVLPEFIDVVDDPTKQEWNGQRLFGHYDVDEEGVVGQRVKLVEKGLLKGYLLSRQPVRGAEASNGHGRLPGPYGAYVATISNLFIEASEGRSAAELKTRLLEIIKERDKPYGMIVRKMDFPSTAPQDELRRLMMGSAQTGGGRPVSPPVLAYRVYPDGREELVRGLRFRGLNVRAFRDVLAVSKDSYAFHYMNNLSPFGVMGGGYVAPSSVIAPSMLFDDLELERPQDDIPKAPLVPPPPLAKAAR